MILQFHESLKVLLKFSLGGREAIKQEMLHTWYFAFRGKRRDEPYCQDTPRYVPQSSFHSLLYKDPLLSTCFSSLLPLRFADDAALKCKRSCTLQHLELPLWSLFEHRSRQKSSQYSEMRYQKKKVAHLIIRNIYWAYILGSWKRNAPVLSSKITRSTRSTAPGHVGGPFSAECPAGNIIFNRRTSWVWLGVTGMGLNRLRCCARKLKKTTN